MSAHARGLARSAYASMIGARIQLHRAPSVRSAATLIALSGRVLAFVSVVEDPLPKWRTDALKAHQAGVLILEKGATAASTGS